ncbi:DCAF17 [Acanthosepion pharaonis]|uniref:DCAF17 n=1 Tax=Acanthosepion pharaonis TaxID=158019 RepID=A0A812D6L4_ACAPH|nr:DCAF17 [Sepia pharaonis]
MLQFPENIYNVYFLARQREYSINYCLLSRIMRSLCCKSQRNYKHVFSLKSKQPIYQCLNLIYMKNYSSSYNGWGIQLWKDVHKEKVTDALFSYGHWDKDPINRIAHKSSILGISQKHKLVRLCAETGTVLESIFLSQIYKFKSIYWDDPHYTAVISSSKVQTQDQSNCPGSMMKAIALFNVFPLEFVGMFAIEKEIFGNDLHDALVSDNLLVTNKRGGIVELFSVDYILEHFLLYKASLYEPDPVTGHIVGMHPFGIPFNIKFKGKIA